VTDPPADASECVIFQALRIQLSSALKGVRLRQNLQAALQQAEEANQLKSRFLSMVSHELRTPLNLIVGLSEMALRQQQRGGKASTELLQKFLEQINVSGQHLDRLIRDVLDLTSSQVGQMNLICQPLDLLPVLRDAASMGSQLAEQKSLHFYVEIPPQLPQVWGDKTRLRQIVLNLLSNAVKFTAHGEIVLKAVSEKDQIVISVRDTGLGIAKADQNKIFGEFYQSDRTTLRGYEGIGLGLAITRRLVEMHGGSIWVTSSELEGGGSTFSFTLPVLRGDKNGETPQSKPRSSIVLILTQNPSSGKTLFQHLTNQGFIVEEVALGPTSDVTERLLSSPPGAVVLDLETGSEQGWEIMKVLKENPGTQDIPVLFYSLLADNDAGSVLEMEYLTKPIGTDQLIKALERHGLHATLEKGQHTLLIVDDEPGILELHARMIQSELPDCRILTARDGREGLATMRQYVPDLVLLDLMMPELDGFGVLKAMRDDQKLHNIPVIVLSGQVLTAREMGRLNRGVVAVLGKGLFSVQETLDRIESVLSRNKQLGSEVRRAVYQAMAYIHEHYKETLSRTNVATHLNLNAQYLSRIFKKEVSVGLMVYLNRYRIQQAKRLLDAGNMTITQVALEVGISSQSYFSRKFQQETGVSPTAYQRLDGPKSYSKEQVTKIHE
jgi:DNA-binding response OmpR family regulator/nitrogen-specific signal transduction histidine kinase